MVALAAVAFAVRENRHNTELAAAASAADARADSLAAQLVIRDSLLDVAAKTEALVPTLAAPDRHELPLFGRDTTTGRLVASQGRAVVTAVGGADRQRLIGAGRGSSRAGPLPRAHRGHAGRCAEDPVK